MTTIHVTASRDYDVLVQPGLLDDAGAQIAQVLGTGRTAAIVSGETVAGLYAARLAASLTRAGFRAVTFPYPGGEHCKTLATYAALLDFLAAFYGGEPLKKEELDTLRRWFEQEAHHAD